MWKRTGPGFLLIAVFILAIVFSGCSGNENGKLPTIKVEFSHYEVNGTHLLEIKEVETLYINRSEAPTVHKEPPFPGIHVFAYNKLDRTPITHLPLDREGENITTYIGFESPESVPKKGQKLLVVIDIVNQKGDSYNTKNKQITWDLTAENPK